MTAALPPLTDFTVPGPDSTTTRRVIGGYLKKLLRSLLSWPEGRFARSAFDVYAPVLDDVRARCRARDTGAVFAALRHPDISARIRLIDAELWGGGDVERLDLWLRELSDGLVTALSPPSEARPRRGALVIDAPMELCVLDGNPLAMLEAHPDKRGNAASLGDHPAEEWLTSLRTALDVITEGLPVLRHEMRDTLVRVVPVGYDANRHESASYAEVIGTAYLSLHPDTMTMAEALVHEFSHNKLNAARWLDPLLLNASGETYASPVRPDPRPILGVLLAVHAFVPVARLYDNLTERDHPLSRSARFRERHLEIIRKNREGTATLREHARPTPAGSALLDELSRWDDHYGSPLATAP